MECNKDDAEKAKKIALEKMEAGDFVGAHKFVTKAQRLFPNLEHLLHMIAICEVHSSAMNKIKGLDNWYGVLQVQPSADADTIKKQYRKLALLLHPDKNNFAGAEAAFKLIGEANRLLSDQIKRSQYDVRYRSHSALAKKHANANSDIRSAATNNGVENIASVFTFWTRCKHCGHRYKYLKEYINTVMHCSSCRKSYVAYNIMSDGMPPSSSTTGNKEFQFQGMYNTSRQNASTGAEMDMDGTVGGKLKKKSQEKQKNSADDSAPKKDESCTENDAEGRKPQNSEAGMKSSAEVPKADVLKPQHQVKEPDTSAAKSIPDSSIPKMNKAAKRRKKTVEESSKSFEVDISDATKAKTDTNETSKRKSSRKKPQVLNAKRGGDGDFVSPPNKKTRSGRQFGSEFNMKQTSEGNKSTEQADSGVSSASSHADLGVSSASSHSDLGVSSASSHADKGKAKENASSGNGEDAALLSRIDKVERKAAKISVNQVWSVADTRDGMPRKYVWVKEVLNPEFKLQIINLEPVRNENDDSMPVACGSFKNGETDVVEKRSIFSGQMHYLKCNEIVSIYPRTGEIWAIFREWNEEWNTSLEKHKLPYTYDIVEIVNDFHDVLGIGVAYLGKLKGSVPLFHQEPKDGVCQIQFPAETIHRFSHKIPAVKMTGKREEDVPANSYKLDLDALPKDVLQVDMEMDREILKGKANGPYPQAPKIEVKAEPVTETLPVSRKRRKSNDDNGVCSNLGEVKGRTNRSHGFSSSEVDENNTPKKSGKNGEVTDVFKLRKSPRLQTIPSQQGDEKKSDKQGNQINNPKKTEKGLAIDSLGVDEKNTPRKKSAKQGKKATALKKTDECLVTDSSGDRKSLNGIHQPAESLQGESSVKQVLVTGSLRVDEKNTPNKTTDVLKLRKSPRLQKIPDQQGDEKKSAKQRKKINTPKKTDKDLMTDSLGDCKSPNGIYEPAESSRKQDSNGEMLSESKTNDLPTQMDGSTTSTYEFPNTTPVSPNCKTPQRNASDFKNMRSEDKFQVNQVWAIYSKDKGIPSEYVQIKKIQTKPKFVLRATELYLPSTEPRTRPMSCGEFILKNGRPKIFSLDRFSHEVTTFDVSKKFRVAVYPRKGDIWFLYKHNTEEHDIVEVVEDDCDGEIVKVVALTAKGSSSLYMIQKKEGSNADIIESIPKSEMSRFSHQIPAFKREKRTTRLVEGTYWELDPIAIPSRNIVLD